MRPLNGQDILHVWERGQAESPLRKALALLEYADPQAGGEELAVLPVGRRDALLLDLREQTFGPDLGGYAECPRCGDRLELAVSAEDLRAAPAVEKVEHTIEMQDLRLRFRVPTSADLLAVAGLSDVETASRVLAQRCILGVDHEGREVDPADLPEDVYPLLEARMAEADPRAEALLNLTCPSCEHSWQVQFDIAEFFWAELAAQARRILQEVHTLAGAYGWREADILSMSGRRRQAYLELVG